MKEICFITQCSLPVPTTQGGAVETLIEYLINENEKYKKFKFIIISIYDEKAKSLSKDYKYTKFKYVKKSSKKLNYILMQVYRILKHLNIYIPFSLEFNKVLKLIPEIKNQNYFIFEAGPTTQLPALSKIIPKEKLLVHLHWDGMSNKRKDKCFSYLLPVSDYIGKQWLNGANCDYKKIKPLYNCTKIERFAIECNEKEKNNLKKSLNIPINHSIIIFTGRIVKEKGIKELLLAFENINQKDITLLVIGSANFGAKTNTKYEQEIDQMIKSSKKNIIFTGFVHQTQLYKYYSIADIAVMPSLFQDPAPLVCIETQATGTPLIATKVGGIPEYSGQNCTILIPRDENLVKNLTYQIERLLKNSELRTEIGNNSKKHAKQFNTESYYHNFCQIIDEISQGDN
ncbi:glycosyltransferase family 4 protein [Clostridium perfringens]|uniref:glycosyltransferase family 4 protein n=1 Tax=Clostridium perfringens TaxID=1502 RepID=UPI002901D459|nr:glycosyltransferase family 4 protein [Clostridium perfringens]EHA1184358.1 glycosyltransferase family 4 protein [Clostridium perfringens]EHK2367092.1 glycosyltransferase family 4 protein [Clostridium perfringens]MDU2325160.1 glycosyltransferase family 4 protein [Clostridium perfringens]